MKFTRFLRFSLCDSIIEFRSKSEIEIQILVLNSFSKKGRQRLLLDGLVLQEDGSVRSRYFCGTVRRRGRSEMRSFAETQSGRVGLTQSIRMPAVTSGYGVGECASPG